MLKMLVWALLSLEPTLPTTPITPEFMVETIYEGGLQDRWQDWGWAPRDTDIGHRARLNFSGYGGWTLVHRSTLQSITAITFVMAAPPRFGNFLEIYVGSETDNSFPHVGVTAIFQSVAPNGEVTIRVPLDVLNPKGAPFDRITLRASRLVDASFVEIDHYGLLGVSATQAADTNVARRASGQIDCDKKGPNISPLIYGISYNPRRNDASQWHLAATSRRWGGSPSSRYNWRLGNAWNSASDWFFMNLNYGRGQKADWDSFLDENRLHGIRGAITLPMLGWVAKDTKSYAYPISVYGPQNAHNPMNTDAGDGLRSNGAKVMGADPRRTSIPAPPEFVGEWVQAIRRYQQAQRTRSVHM